jgi:hypothetical protein
MADAMSLLPAMPAPYDDLSTRLAGLHVTSLHHHVAAAVATFAPVLDKLFTWSEQLRIAGSRFSEHVVGTEFERHMRTSLPGTTIHREVPCNVLRDGRRADKRPGRIDFVVSRVSDDGRHREAVLIELKAYSLAAVADEPETLRARIQLTRGVSAADDWRTMGEAVVQEMTRLTPRAAAAWLQPETDRLLAQTLVIRAASGAIPDWLIMTVGDAVQQAAVQVAHYARSVDAEGFHASFERLAQPTHVCASTVVTVGSRVLYNQVTVS